MTGPREFSHLFYNVLSVSQPQSELLLLDTGVGLLLPVELGF